MSDKFESREALIGKIDWEGGIESALEYGVKPHMMPDDELQVLWLELQEKWDAYYDVALRVSEVLEY